MTQRNRLVITTTMIVHGVGRNSMIETHTEAGCLYNSENILFCYLNYGQLVRFRMDFNATYYVLCQCVFFL